MRTIRRLTKPEHRKRESEKLNEHVAGLLAKECGDPNRPEAHRLGTREDLCPKCIAQKMTGRWAG